MRSLVTVALFLCGVAGAAAAPEQQTLHGRRLDEALRLLQQRGLRIVFSTELVTPDMRVLAEPRATTLRQQLDELLEAHGLRAEPGPAGVIQIVRASHGPRLGATKKPVTGTIRAVPRGNGPRAAAQPMDAYAERVTVTASRITRADHGATEETFDVRGLQAGTAVLQDDGLQAIHAWPRVAAADDFRSEFSVRSSPARQVAIVIDGVSTPWLEHAMYGRSDAGSLSMFGSTILESATLSAGAYPRRYGDTLGAQLELRLRDGSREAKRFAGSLGGTSATVVGEGPLGANGRGSWIASARNSYRTWPARPRTPNDVGFAFTDAYAKLVLDATPAQQLSVTAVGGRSTLDVVDEPLPSPLGTGTNRAALLTAAWRSAFNSGTVVRQQLSFVDQRLLNTLPTGQPDARKTNRALIYHAEALRSLFGGSVETSGEIRRVSGARDLGLGGPAVSRDEFGATWSTRSAYLNFSRPVARGVSIATGFRASQSTLAHGHSLARWILGEWSFRPGWAATVSAGASRQFPELDMVRSGNGSSPLVPERATHVDVAIERRLRGLRWQVTLFKRVERDVLQASDPYARLVDDVVVEPPSAGRYDNSLRGASQGLELVATREASARLSGWISYAYATTRQTDALTQETFWGDFDRRHLASAAGVWRITDRTTVGGVFRGASNIPIPGYFAEREGRLFVSERRNAVRLLPYMRLDARAQRAFGSSSHRVTMFAELLNALNRQNQVPVGANIRPPANGTVGLSRSLMPRSASVGLTINLAR